jgi:nitroimidazol reductase NimA-like FMN-containing flavoprotein (pyridoxamine 5'-phosphate oxidase superfamily)
MTIDEYEEYGMRRMDDDDIKQTLSNQSVGVLGLPTESAPCLRPLSYWFDGESKLYFVYVLSTDSQKTALSDRANTAQFLVYRIETTFNWRSVLLTGTVERVPEDDREAIEETMDISWRPELFERGTGPENTGLYQLQIDERDGIKQLERPFTIGDD